MRLRDNSQMRRCNRKSWKKYWAKSFLAAALPRILEGDPLPPKKVRPRTLLLGEGRELDLPYYLHEEEVPRAGVYVTQAFQRTRWRNGTVFVWLGVRKQTGRGEGSSGLAFDRIVDVKPAS